MVDKRLKKNTGVFIVKVNNENFKEVYDEINETRLTKEFFEECERKNFYDT